VGVLNIFSAFGEWLNNIVYPGNDLFKYIIIHIFIKNTPYNLYFNRKICKNI